MTDSPPGTDQESDDVTECHTSGENFGGPVARGRSPRAALPHAVYTSVQMLEIHPKNCHSCHFFGSSARLPGGTARSARRCGISRSDMMCAGPDHSKPSGYRCTKSATPISADCSLSLMAYNDTRSARVGDTGPRWIPAPQVACPGVDLAVTRQSSFLNQARFSYSCSTKLHSRAGQGPR